MQKLSTRKVAEIVKPRVEGFCLVARVAGCIVVDVDRFRDGFEVRRAAAVAALHAAGVTFEQSEEATLIVDERPASSVRPGRIVDAGHPVANAQERSRLKRAAVLRGDHALVARLNQERDAERRALGAVLLLAGK